MLRTVVVVGTLLLGVGVVAAQQDLVKHAQTFMKGNGKNAGALGAIVKGEKPYDQATVDAALAQFEDTAKKLPTLFPASIKGLGRGDYSCFKLGRQGRLRAHMRASAGGDGRPKPDKDLDTLKGRSPAIGKNAVCQSLPRQNS